MPSAARAWSSRSTGIMSPLCGSPAGGTSVWGGCRGGGGRDNPRHDRRAVPGHAAQMATATRRRARRGRGLPRPRRPADRRGARDPARAGRGRGTARAALVRAARRRRRPSARRGAAPDARARLPGPPVRFGVRARPRAARRGPVAVRRRRRRHRRRWPPTSAIHEEVVRGLAARGRNRVSGTFRAAVFGANDGLVSNLALVLGIGGGGAADHDRPAHRASPGCWPARCRWARASTCRCARSASCSTPRRPDAGGAARRCRTSTSTPTSSRSSTGRAGWQPREADAARDRGAAQRRPARSATPAAEAVDEHEVGRHGLGAACRASASSPPARSIPVLPYLFGLPELVALGSAVSRRARAADRRHGGRAVGRAAAAAGAAPARHRVRRSGRHLLPGPALRHGYRLTGDSSSRVTGEPSGWRRSGRPS